MSQRRATEKFFFACIQGDGQCERADVIWFFSRFRRNKRRYSPAKKKNVKNWKAWLGHLIKQRETVVSKEGHRKGEEERQQKRTSTGT